MFSMGSLLKRQVAILILLPLLFGGAAFLFTRMVITPEYSATATVVVRVTSIDNQDMQYEEVLASQTLAKMVVGVAQSQDIAGKVSATLDDPALTADSLIDSAAFTLLPDSSIISVEYTDADANRAAKVANQYIDVLEAEVPTYYKGALLTHLDYATAPEFPSKPNAALNTLAAVLAGLATAVVWSYVIANYTHYQ